MVDSKIIDIVKRYLSVLAEKELVISKAFIYGSYAKGTATEESDIDLMLVSPLFDKNIDSYIPLIWLSTRNISYKIEPIAIGESRFFLDDTSPLIETVRQEGVEIVL